MKIGDRVKVKATHYEAEICGEVGIIIEYDDEMVGVEFVRDVEIGHNLDGEISSHNGWWIDEDYLERISENKIRFII